MSAPDEKGATKRLREWWRSPPRSGMQRLIAPPEFRRLSTFWIIHVVGGIAVSVVGILCLSYEAYAWAAVFLVIAVIELAAGYWELTIARSSHYREAIRARP